MPDSILIDTDVIIDASRNRPEAVQCLEVIELQASLAISVVTQMELIVGCRDNSELRSLERLLLRFQLFQLTEQISDTAVNLLTQYRLSHGLLIADALIASTAISINQPMVTKNQRDYRFIEGLQLLDYPLPFGSP